MKPLLTLLLLSASIRFASCACGRPNVFPGIHTFGPECRYRCNCLNNEPCDGETGDCPNGCLPGWMGPACQYRNLAAAANIANSAQNPPSSEFPAKYAVDGDVSTCSRTGSTGSGQNHLTIDLGSKVYISGLIIIFPSSELNSYRGFAVTVGNDSTTFTLCYADNRDGEIKSAMDICCITPQVGQQIRIVMAKESPARLSVCEMNIYGGRLVSFNQQTEMDSTYVNSYGTYDGVYAVDGGIYRNKADSLQTTETRTCASTEADYTTPHNRWWRVDLLYSFSIQAVSFFARQDGNLWQHAGYFITLSVDNILFTEMARDLPSNNPTDYQPKYHNLTWPKDGRLVVVNRDNATILTICEVEIFAECAYGSCGWNCNKTCMCSSQTSGEHKILGTCPHGCAGRWTGINGQCNMECPDNKWGPTCGQSCGYCTQPCDVMNGTCPGHCYPGWEPPYCLKDCANGTYGPNCLENCGNCQVGTKCNSYTGQCDDGCRPGYKAPYCEHECDAGSYGQSCAFTCGSCRNNEACHHINGTCLNKCEPGFQGHTCQEVCSDTVFGLECKNVCGKCQNGDKCNNVNGQCPAGCAPGFETEPLCNKFCDIGSFGNKCSERCGHCLNGETCHHENGICFNGCEAGYMGRDCKLDCPDGKFGANCLGKCGACNIVTNCHKKTGECSNGCIPGWQGRNCTKPCEDGFYGISCYLKCGHCKDGHPCDPQTGHCLLCEAGYTGEYCTSICTEGRYGEGCQHTCGRCAGNESCNRTSGACAHGCSDQFTGSLCLEDTSSSGTIGWIIGTGVFIAATIVAVFIIGILIYQRRQLKTELSSAYTASTVIATVSEDETYDVIIRSPGDKIEQYENSTASN